MYKYYEKDEYSIMHYYFDSIHEFLDYIDNHETNKCFDGCRLSSTVQSDNNWSGTVSLEEAEELARYGYSEDFEKFLKLKIELERYIKINTTKSKQFNWYVGYTPDVKAYLEGSPLSMLNKMNPIRKQIDIYFNASYSAGTKTSQIYNRGIITLSIVDVLEKLGFLVNLNIFNMAYDDEQVHYAVFRLKNTSERINIKKLYFPMCHNSWLRRLVFRLIEETPYIRRSWNHGYGAPADESLIREIIDLKQNDIVIPQPKEINITGNDLIDDANKVFEYINKKRNTEDFELPTLKRTKK